MAEGRAPARVADSGTGLELLVEVADMLEVAAGACDDAADASRFSQLADRVRAYLSSSRPTTPLGMPHILAASRRLQEDMVVHRSPSSQSSHVRIVSE